MPTQQHSILALLFHEVGAASRAIASGRVWPDFCSVLLVDGRVGGESGESVVLGASRSPSAVRLHAYLSILYCFYVYDRDRYDRYSN